VLRWTTEGQFLLASAQVDVWLATHKGSLDDVSLLAQEPSGDDALARMMLHRRRAVVARVVDEFFEGLGDRFTPYLESRAPQLPRSVAGELENAKKACGIAESLCEVAPPLRLERALVAVMEGRRADALADLDELLKLYPGYRNAAIVCARLSLALDNPQRAVQSLICVASELNRSREGAALLADALHAMGMHRAGRWYDLGALMCSAYVDSTGNACAPVDMNGDIAVDKSMPDGTLIGCLPDGRLVCNDRGLYYVRRPVTANLLAGVLRAGSEALDPLRKLTIWNSFLQPFRFLKGTAKRWRTTLAVPGIVVNNAQASGEAASAEVPKPRRVTILRAVTRQVSQRIASHPHFWFLVYRTYKRLPEPVRYSFNKYIVLPVRRFEEAPWQKMNEPNWQSKAAREQLHSGIAQILQSSAPAFAGFEPIEIIDVEADDKDDDAGISFIKAIYRRRTKASFASRLEQLLERGKLPPAAAEIFENLVHEAVSSKR
jgi:hypothetical protein